MDRTLPTLTPSGKMVYGRPMISWVALRAAAIRGLEQAYWSQLYDATGGNVSAMARLSGAERNHVRIYLRRHGLGGGKGKGGRR